MRRRRRWFAILVPLPLVLACAMMREGNPATTPGPDFGPCGSWIDCGTADGPENRCCPPTMACARDDGGPYCATDEAYDPADPVTWGSRPRDRQPRAATGPR